MLVNYEESMVDMFLIDSGQNTEDATFISVKI